MEVIPKEVRRNILCNINIIEDEVSFENIIILDCININNNYIHIVTGLSPHF